MRATTVIALLGVAAGILAACSPAATAEPCAPGARTVGSSPEDLQQALDAAEPGDVLQLADATYAGHFRITTSGAGEQDITLCGSRDALIDGGDSGYAIHLDGASHWILDGFTVTGGAKGIVLDASESIAMVDLEVSQTGEEGIHLRSGSTHNSVRDSTVHHTGLTTPQHGSGISVGSAESNWCEYSACAPDASDDNGISRNTIRDTAAEAIDVKEGTRGGSISGNTLSIASDADADSVVDVRGNDWAVRDNRFSAASQAGVQVHTILKGWGQRNVVLANAFDIAPGGYAVEVVGDARTGGNGVGCDNVTASDRPAPMNVTCTDVYG
jgi:hypothetical protein